MALREHAALARFYARRAGRLAWANDPRAVLSLVDAVRGAGTHGLRPVDYHAETLAAVSWTAEPSRQLPDALMEPRVERDLLLSDTFLRLARALSVGAVDPRALDPSYRRADVPPDPVEALEAALARGDVAAVLAGLAPPHSEYAGLREGLARLRADSRAPGCPQLPDGPMLRLGDRDPRVVVLRTCLMASNSMSASPKADPMRLDAALVEVLRRFQHRHGLSADGVLGPATRAALLVTRAERIDQVRVNLERWRWQGRDPGARWLRVDVPQYRLRAFEGGAATPTLEMRVVVGRPEWETPQVHALITHLVLNPSWRVPHSIFVEEMVPRAQQEADYFAVEGLELWEQGDGDWLLAEPDSVDWARLDPDSPRYRVSQPPGPRNPLGRIKFMFENAHAVYLHGTPSRSVLERPERVLSHGCVRVEDELALARWVLAPDPTWSMERIERELERVRMEPVVLPEPLPVHLVYFTAEADAKGALSFASDPYGWDPLLLDLLGSDDSASRQLDGRARAGAPELEPGSRAATASGAR